MMLTLQDYGLTILESLEQFLAGTATLAPRVSDSEAQRQAHVRTVLERFSYQQLGAKVETKSMEEIRGEYISAMGEELGANFYELSRKLVELHVVWQQYRQLFGDELETVHLLNRTSGLFFKIVQDELWDSVLLGISRMTDPPVTGKSKNLTIQSLPALINNSTLRMEVQALCDKALASAVFAREHRNKRIVHQDHNYLSNRSSNTLSGISRALVEEMLAALRAVLNHLDNRFLDSTVMYENFVDESGASLLVQKLRWLERLQESSARASQDAFT